VRKQQDRKKELKLTWIKKDTILNIQLSYNNIGGNSDQSQREGKGFVKIYVNILMFL